MNTIVEDVLVYSGFLGYVLPIETPLEFLMIGLPWILLIGWTIYGFWALYSKDKKRAWVNYHIIEHIPAVFVTLGVLGTFAGVALGLITFDFNVQPSEIQDSISGLINGLRNAFFTSLYGLFFSFVSSLLIRVQYQKGALVDPEIEKEQQMISELKTALEDFGANLVKNNSEAIMSSLKRVIEDFNDTFTTLIGELVTESFKELTNSVNKLVYWQQEYRISVNELLETNKAINKRTIDLIQGFNTTINNLDKVSDSSTSLQQALNSLRSSIEDESSLSGLINKLEKSSDNLVQISNDADVYKNELEKIVQEFISSQEKIEGWLKREDGVLDAATAMNHALSELRQFDISQIEELDKSFNSRLQTTFKNLDNLMKTYVQYLENKAELDRS